MCNVCACVRALAPCQAQTRISVAVCFKGPTRLSQVYLLPAKSCSHGRISDRTSKICGLSIKSWCFFWFFLFFAVPLCEGRGWVWCMAWTWTQRLCRTLCIPRSFWLTVAFLLQSWVSWVRTAGRALVYGYILLNMWTSTCRVGSIKLLVPIRLL